MKKSRKSELGVMGNKYMVIDAAGLILGRLASNVAKKILNGEEVTVVNAEKTVILGRKKFIVERFQKRLGTRTLGSQNKAPQHPRRPDTYLRRVVRGMIPWRKPKGKEAYKRLKVFVGLPKSFSKKNVETIPEAKTSGIPSITVGELMMIFGWQS